MKGRFFRAAVYFLIVLMGWMPGGELFAGGRQGAASILQELESAFVSLAEKVRPSVVSLSPYVPPSPSVKRLGSLNHGRPTNSAAGVIVDGEKGLIVTNSHVVRNAEKLEVKLLSGETFVGRVLGQDEDTDLALIRVESPKALPAARLGDSSRVKVGQLVVAVGNPYGLHETLTFGVVSGLNRENINLSRYEDFIQTDASINPGNSGGPLMNIRGEVIGINTAIINYAQSIGFAIPSNMVKSILAHLIEFGEVRRGWLGVGIEPVTELLAKRLTVESGRGVYVNSTFEGDPAYEAGIREGDIILKIGGAAVDSPNGMIRLIGAIHPGQKVDVDVWRGGSLKKFSVALGIRKDKQSVALLPEDVFPSLGIQVSESREDENEFPDANGQEGLVIARIIPDSPADKIGLLPGDRITSVNGENVVSPGELGRILKGLARGKPVDLNVSRNNEILSLTLE